MSLKDSFAVYDFFNSPTAPRRAACIALTSDLCAFVRATRRCRGRGSRYPRRDGTRRDRLTGRPTDVSKIAISMRLIASRCALRVILNASRHVTPSRTYFLFPAMVDQKKGSHEYASDGSGARPYTGISHPVCLLFLSLIVVLGTIVIDTYNTG